MSDAAAILLAVTLVVAVADWIAVQTGQKVGEVVAKPLTMVVLGAMVATLDDVDATARTWWFAAIVLCLIGDIFLLRPEKWFVPGLASFLLGHLAYIGGFAALGVSGGGLAIGGVVVAAGIVTIGRKILGAVRASDEPELLPPVAAYVGVISVMVTMAFGSGEPAAIAGALLFYASDALIAWNRFVEAKPWGRLAIITTYHLGQIGLALTLLDTATP